MSEAFEFSPKQEFAKENIQALKSELKYVTCPACNGEVSMLDDSGVCWDCAEAKDQENRQGERLKEVLGGQRAYDFYTFDTYKVVAGNKRAVDYAKLFNPAKNNVYFWGWCGAGKDHLAKAMVRGWVAKGKSIYIVSAHQILNEAWGESSNEERVVRKYSECAMLYLEDLGLGTLTQNGIRIISRVLNGRIDNGLNGLVATSNFSIEQLARSLNDDRIPSRLKGLCVEIKVAPKNEQGQEIDWRLANAQRG